jgi:prophage antirepressor-like protein
MSIIIDIFNNLLKYNEKEIFIVVDINNQIWFKLKDILKILNYKNLKKALYISSVSDINKKTYVNIQMYPSRGTSANIHKYTIFIDEAGLYKLLTNSTKELAKKFRDEVFSSILPTIRKTGSYNISNMNKIKTLNKEIIELKNNQRNIKYPKGKAIYIIKKVINNKRYYKIGYTKDLNNRLKVYNTGTPNKQLYKYFCLIKDASIDICIKKYLRNKEFIKNKEYYVSNIKQIIKIINSCDKRITELCCGYCMKCKKIKDIIQHKCKFII